MTVDQFPSYLRRHWQKVKHSSRWNVLTAAGAAEGTTKAPGRNAVARHSRYARSHDSAGYQSGSTEDLVACIFCQQLWLPPEALSTPSYSSGQVVCGTRVKACRQYAPLEFFRPGSSRSAYESPGYQGAGQAATETHPEVPHLRDYDRGGVVEPAHEGTPQGGPLSPLLSNIVLDELDKELENRKLHTVRYADDFLIFVRSKRVATRVMRSFTSKRGDTRIRIHSKSFQRSMNRVRWLTDRNCG